MTRRTFLPVAAAPTILHAAPRKPNIVFILSDDQGYGDLSIHGNPHLKTPHIDSIARDGVQFTQFHANPVCSPTRASVMTGRYYYRTGVVDTYIGRSMMAADEVTIPEVLRGAGYRTGLFGKWHLGDHYPMRAMDQGFDETVSHFGGGIGQPSDLPGGESYFNPLLQVNGKTQRFPGYCTDIFFNEAMKFIEANRSRPFFTYIATNAPHTPLEIAEERAEPYRKQGLSDRDARLYGMVENLDSNTGRLLAQLKKLNLERETIVIFMTDNGPQWPRFNGGMRGTKGTVYEGGVRVPFFMKWPGRVQPGRTTNGLAAHIDLFPTFAELCGGKMPTDRKIDGRSLAPLIDGKGDWPDRTLFFQWHRGDAPEHWRSACARTQRWKLVNGKELYDLEADPAESTDVAAKNSSVADRLRSEYDAWFKDVCGTRGFDPIRIPIGTAQENPVMLSQQDWRGPRAVWGPEALGHWEVDVANAGRYEAQFLIRPMNKPAELRFSLSGVDRKVPVEPGVSVVSMGDIQLPKGPGRLEAVISLDNKTFGVRFSTLTRL